MRSIFTAGIVLVLLLASCNPFVKKPKEEVPTDTVHVKTADELLAEEKARQDSIEQARYEQMQQTPFGDLRFGMNSEATVAANEKRQKLGKYFYNFSYSFTPDDQLYKVRMVSDGIKAIRYDTDLKFNYLNLLKIISNKYGEPATRHEYPSIFEVQDVKKYSMNTWNEGRKQIQLSLVENGINSYLVLCEISDQNMSSAEQERLKNEKNRDVIEASEKF